ncbi:MAG: hypothetical protein U9Q71_08940 [Pseudomonadota bacterium]|nr:hypothetical protein [Pseudomonadota bacterium]
MENTGKVPGKTLAVVSEGLYLLNLLFPLVTWLALLVVYLRQRDSAPELGKIHLRQTFVAATLSSTIFLFANLLVLVLGGYRSISTLVIFEVYFMAVVPLFFIPGLIGLIKAMSEQPYRFPLIGRRVLADKPRAPL